MLFCILGPILRASLPLWSDMDGFYLCYLKIMLTWKKTTTIELKPIRWVWIIMTFILTVNYCNSCLDTYSFFNIQVESIKLVSKRLSTGICFIIEDASPLVKEALQLFLLFCFICVSTNCDLVFLVHLKETLNNDLPKSFCQWVLRSKPPAHSWYMIHLQLQECKRISST